MNLRLYFIAIIAPNVIDDYVRSLKEEMRLQYGCKAALKSPAHITLVPPFKMNDELEQSLKRQLDTFAFKQDHFSVNLQNFSAFKPRVIYVAVNDSDELQSLYADLNHALTSEKVYGIIPETREFHPHVTIATRDLRKQDFHRAWERFSNEEYKATFEVGEIALLRNTPGRWDIVHRARFGTRPVVL